MNEFIKVNAEDLKSFSAKGFNPKSIYQSEDMKVILAYFKKGQFIPVHTPKITVILCILDGEAEIVADDEKTIAKKGDIIIVPDGIKRGEKAITEELTVLHIVQPPPSDGDHKEVHEKISKGRFD